MRSAAIGLLLALVVGVAQERLVAVDVRPAGTEQELAGLGVLAFGRTDNYILVADAPGLAEAGLGGQAVMLEPGIPAYLVYCEAWPAAPPAFRPLFSDGDWRLGQLGSHTAMMLAQAGYRLVRLPEKPYRLVLAGPVSFAVPTEVDTFIQRLVGMVSPDSIRSHIRMLEAVRTRFSPTESCRSAEEQLARYFEGLGLDSVRLDTYGAGWRNVVGTRLGRLHPEKVVIICGHMDAISEDPYNLAPGAEDNASGTAMAIEAARILCRENLDQTVRFVAFTGEEQGLLGSQHYAQQARQRGEDIIGVTNYDMVAWPGGRWGVRLVGIARAQRLCRLQAQMATLYTALGYEIQKRSFPSDSKPFEEQGYVATSGFEYGTEPYIWYHTTGDTLGNISMGLAADVARMAVATIATLAVAPVPPEDFSLRDEGSGTTLRASWQPNTEPDLAGYRLFWGADSLAYADSVELGPVASHTIAGLAPGTRYYAAVAAVDSAGRQSGLSAQRSAVPNAVPSAPARVEAWPFSSGVRVQWLAGPELDIAGYNLYRSTVSGSGYVRLNSGLLTDTTYRDSALLSDTMYYYVATAVDTSANESPYSAEVRGKPVTLDHGILLVDETRDGSGQPGSPSDLQQDEFYHALLAGFRYTDWDVAGKGVPAAADFGPYSTIVWHADEYQQPLVHSALPGLANQLGWGGRLWLVGWKPVLGLMNGLGSYPYTFAPGQFCYDYFRLGRAEQSQVTDFIGAEGACGYPSVGVDSTKTLPVLHGRLPYVDAVLPRDADTVLTFVSFSGDTFAGKPVGVRWLAGPHRAVLFGFPLYYTKQDEARVLARRVLEDLGEPYGIEEGQKPQASSFKFEVGPNPARNLVRISYSVPTPGTARLAIYDAAGRVVLVRSIPQSPFPNPYSLDVRSLSAGVYFVRLEAGRLERTCRLVVLN